MTIELSPKAAEIASSARALLALGGYNGFSYADISDQVRIAKASIHHHFASKADLVEVVVKLHREESNKGLASLTEQVADPVAELKAYADYWSACILDGSTSFCICAMLAAELPAVPGNVAREVQAFFQDLTAWLAGVFKRGASSGAFHLQGTPAQEAKAFMATVYGAMLAARAYGDPRTFQAVVFPAIERLAAPTRQ